MLNDILYTICGIIVAAVVLNFVFDLFTYEQACDLDYTLALTLAEAIHEVNNKKK